MIMQVDLNRTYSDTGVIFVPRLLDAHRTSRLRVISEHCLCQWRLKDGRPNYDETVMRHLNDPAYYDQARRSWLTELLDIVADPGIIAAVEEVLGGKALFRSTSLFFNPLLTSREGNWHRDSQFLHPKREDDDARVMQEAAHVSKTGMTSAIQLQIALVPSEDTEYVPGSHLRLDTNDEAYIRFADNQKYNGSSLMPNAVRTHQEPGDAAAFNPFGLHRGRYHTDKYRRTFMFTYTHSDLCRLEDYFSDQPWCLSEGYLDGTQPHTKKFFEEFIDVYKPFWNRKK
jgi:hypothetical protein